MGVDLADNKGETETVFLTLLLQQRCRMQVDRIQHRIINSAQLADFILCFDMNARLVFALRNTFHCGIQLLDRGEAA